MPTDLRNILVNYAPSRATIFNCLAKIKRGRTVMRYTVND